LRGAVVYPRPRHEMTLADRVPAVGPRGAGSPMHIEIPETVVHALRLPESETAERLRTELAAALYERGILPFGRARELAGLGRLAFAHLLCARGISRHYTSEELSDDVDYARRQ